MNRLKKMRKKIIGLLLMMLICVAPLTSFTVSAAEAVTGNFTAVCMNVDGLPLNIMGIIDINPDGPGSDGTRAISAKMAQYGWDIIGVSEDFNYHSELMSNLPGYTCGTSRGGVSSLKNDTDGLNLLWKNNISVSGEKCVSWNTHYSTGIFGTGNGADGMIDKGYRYYQVTLAENVSIDVYILHMDADSDAGDIAARESQLEQLAKAITSSNNGNPIIVMGDTNCRYTREKLQTLFIDTIDADERFTIQDAWIEKVRGGDYPAVGDDAIVAVDKGGSFNYPEAEIVDKLFYINNTDSKVTLTAAQYSVVTDFVDENGAPLADHWPVAVDFTYTLAGEEHVHSYTETVTKEPTCIEVGEKTFTCECGDSYTEEIAAVGHTLVEIDAVEPDCTHAGHTAGQYCKTCGTIITQPTETPALGHTFENGICTVCGAVEESEGNKQVLGEETRTIVPGEQYVVVFTSSAGNYNLDRSGTNITPGTFALKQGDTLDNVCKWKIEKAGNKYVFSTDIDGETYYLFKNSVFTGSGYQLGLTTSQDKASQWSMSYQSSTGSLRFYVQPGFACYYLRYYNARIGWQAALSAAGVHLYTVDTVLQ